MPPSFVVYIDESGDEGFAFHRGASKWFVISAVVTRKETDLDTTKLVDRVKTALARREKDPLHFRNIKHVHRLPFLSEIAKAKIRCISILIHKPSIKEPEKFQEKYRLYYYSVRLLLERVSWLCRDHKSPKYSGDGTAEIIFSNRAGMSYDEMKRYLEYLHVKTDDFGVRIVWENIKTEQIHTYSPGSRMGLQIADAVASSFYFAVNPTAHGFTEDRYARMLKPIVYQRGGHYVGYGIKLWPTETSEMISANEYLGWIRTEFGGGPSG